MKKTYLPYVTFFNNKFSYDKNFSSLEEAFHTFNIIKCLNDKDIYGFKILTDKTICNYEDVFLYNLLFNNNNNDDDDDDNDIKNKNEDNTIPEYLKKVSTKTVNDTISNQIMSLLKSTTTTTTTTSSNDKKLIYSVGYLEFQSFLHYMDNIKLYKNLLLKEKQDCIKYKDINNTFLKHHL